MVTQMFQLRSAQPASYSECKLARSHVRDTSVQIRALDYIYMLFPTLFSNILSQYGHEESNKSVEDKDRAFGQ